MAKKRILLVEDEAVTAMDLQSNLIRLGYEVPAFVASGEDAIRAAAESSPDLILMDISLAGPMTGIEAADVIRKTHAIPIIFLTAHADDVTLGRAKRTEPFGYLPKPCSLDTLVTTIEVALYKSEADAQRRGLEAALKESEEKFRTVADHTYDWEYWVGADDKFVYISPSCEKVSGRSAAAFVADPALLRQIVHPDDIAAYDSHRQEAKVRQEPGEVEFRIVLPDGSIRWVAHACQPVRGDQGQFIGTRASNRDITKRKAAELERERLVAELQAAMAKVKLLTGFIPICASCKKIRNDAGYWQQIEVYIRDHSEAVFSHGICPDCGKKLYGEYYHEGK
jgi:PAS domain S-box-containing protein